MKHLLLMCLFCFFTASLSAEPGGAPRPPRNPKSLKPAQLKKAPKRQPKSMRLKPKAKSKSKPANTPEKEVR